MTEASVLAFVLRSTVVLTLGLLCLRLARLQSASLRHVIVSATLATVALLPLTIAWLPDLPIVWRWRVVVAAPALPFDRSAAAAPPRAGADTSAHQRVSLASVAVVAWAAGAGGCLLPLLFAIMQTRRIGRVGHPWRVEDAVVPTIWGSARLTIPVILHEDLASPVACGVYQPFIALPASAPTWSAVDVERALVHELAHVRRRDVLIQGLARVICAIYWFHPLVWCCWQRLRLEAERGCDDAVLAQFDAADYASQLLRIARGGAGRTASLVPMMARRGELASRIDAILDTTQCRSRHSTALVLPIMLVALVSAALAGSVTPIVGYERSASSRTTRAFAMSTITETTSNSPMTLIRDESGPVRMSGVTLETLIRLAYGVQAESIVNTPAWARTTRFDLQAAPPAPASSETTRLMLQGLLMERFGLEVVDESRLQRVLVVTLPERGGSQQPATPCEPDMQRPMHDAGRRCGFQVAPGRIDATAVDAEALAATLATTLGVRVFVECATPGTFDMHLRWRSDVGVPALLEALKSQAGAMLAEHERHVPVLAVRAVHRPI